MLRTLHFLLHGSMHFTRRAFERNVMSRTDACMTRQLDGKLCVVTGANQGLGRATAEVRTGATAEVGTRTLVASGCGNRGPGL